MEAVIRAAKAVLREELDKVEVHPCDYQDDTVRASRLYGPYRELWEAIAEQANGQAAPVLAGGDAVKIPRTAEEIIAFIGSHFDYMKDMPNVEDTRYGLSIHDLQSAFNWWFGYEEEPVAEAAAQADDVSVIGGFGTTWPAAPTAQPTPEQQGEINAALDRADAEDAARLPAAQPTPSKTVEFDGIAAQPTPRVTPELTQRAKELLDRVEERRAARAQPTPPDDERAAFEAAAMLITCAGANSFEREGDGYQGYMIDMYWQFWKASRAALRQPGALPDGAEDAAKIDYLSFAEGYTSAYKKYSDTPKFPDWEPLEWDCWVRDAYNELHAARAAAATK